MSNFPFFFRRCARLFVLSRRHYWQVEHNPESLRIPTSCACCNRVAGVSRREWAITRDHCVIVPYCEPCARHESRAGLLYLGAHVGSVLVAVSSSILLCLSWLPLWAIVAGAVGLSLLPQVFVAIFGVSRQLGHAVRGRAVWVAGDQVVMASTPWANELAALNGLTLRQVRLRSWRWGGWGVAGPLLSVLLAPFAYQVFCPSLRVLNFTDTQLTLFVDEHNVGQIEPTSGESPAAGQQFRVPSGRRRLRASSGQGHVVSDVSVILRNGSRHLFAPGAREGCLYVQRLAYGRSGLNQTADYRVVQVEPLQSEQRFWVVASDIDPWFVPERASKGGVTTGGVVSLMRMGRCR